jgi:hypothetical protein
MAATIGLAGPASAAGPCVGATTSFGCGEVVTESCTLNADMNCAGFRHGLIVGAPNITIDGAGFMIDGGGTAGRNCQVDMVVEYDECLDHPCRYSRETDANGNMALPSGILNAVASNGASGKIGGCNPNAKVGEGGCDFVTVKNLEITGFCNGITMNGDCTVDPAGGSTHGRSGSGLVGDTTSDKQEYRLSGIQILGNVIQGNGKDCGNIDLGLGICGFDETNFNDAIYLAQVGSNAELKPPAEKPTFCYTGTTVKDMPAGAVLVRHNVIKAQKGCACENCPGGSAINLNGGLEVPSDWGRAYEAAMSGGQEVAKNKIVDMAFSGIQFHHGTQWNRIHGNFIADTGYGAIISGCDWITSNHIYSNVAIDIFGPAYGFRCPVNLWNNIAFGARTTSMPIAWPQVGAGVALMCEAEGSEFAGANGSCIYDNNLLQNEGGDIYVLGNCDAATADLNECLTTLADGVALTDATGFLAPNDGCTYRYPLTSGNDGFGEYITKHSSANQCNHDSNKDGKVTGLDYADFWGPDTFQSENAAYGDGGCFKSQK